MTATASALLSTLVANRASTYRFLARVYRIEADRELLDQMRKMDFSAEVEEPEVREGYRLLAAYLQHPPSDELTDLAVDYAWIFLGAGRLERPEAVAYPYESVYTSPERLLMQEARDEVLLAYRAEGLDKAEEFHEPEDHVALELEFMAYLCQKAAGALEAGEREAVLSYLQKQKDFLSQHLLRWVPTFCADVQGIARTDFYKAVARITVGCLGLERELIDELAREIEGSQGNGE